MKYLCSLLFSFISSCLFSQTVSENIYLLTDRSHYELQDTIFIQGMILDPEHQQLSTLSKYCYIEMINLQGEILQQAKVRSENGLFSCAFPIESLPSQNSLLIRAYTRFMENFLPSVSSLRLIEVGPLSKKTIAFKEQEETHFPLQLRYREGVLIYNYLPENQKEYVMTVYVQNGIMNNYPLSQQPTGSIPILFSPPFLLNCFVTDVQTDHIVYHQFINVPSMADCTPFAYDLPADQYLPGHEIEIPLPSSTGDTLFIIHCEEERGKELHNTTLRKQFNELPTHFGEKYKSLLQQQFAYTHLPELILSFKGTVSKSIGKLKKGTVTAFDHNRGLHYDCDIQPNGSFEMGVDDYPRNTSFYLQAFNDKGKADDYEIEIMDNMIPSVQIPILEVKIVSHSTWPTPQSVLDTTSIHWIPEVVVEAKMKKERRVPSSAHFYKVNYITSEDLENESNTDLESIYRRLRGVKINYDEKTGLPFLTSTRGPSTFGGRFSESNGQSREVGIPIFLDGYKINPEESIFDILNVSDLKSIEYIPSTRANLYGPGSLDGIVVIYSKDGKSHKKEAKSYGRLYTPLGISPSLPESVKSIQTVYVKAGTNAKCKLELPKKQGKYILIIEKLAKSKQLTRKEYPFSISK